MFIKKDKKMDEWMKKYAVGHGNYKNRVWNHKDFPKMMKKVREWKNQNLSNEEILENIYKICEKFLKFLKTSKSGMYEGIHEKGSLEIMAKVCYFNFVQNGFKNEDLFMKYLNKKSNREWVFASDELDCKYHIDIHSKDMEIGFQVKGLTLTEWEKDRIIRSVKKTEFKYVYLIFVNNRKKTFTKERIK